jgi:hypothetical protein
MYAAPPFEVYSEHLLFITPKTTSNKCETNHENDKEERKHVSLSSIFLRSFSIERYAMQVLIFNLK